MIKNEDFLHIIQNTTYCKIGVSEVHGIGVIAIRDIPKGVDPFLSLGSNNRFLCLTEEEINTLDKDIQDHLRSYYIRTEGTYPVMAKGFNEVCIFGYMNHSDNPNMGLYIKDESELTEAKKSFGHDQETLLKAMNEAHIKENHILIESKEKRKTEIFIHKLWRCLWKTTLSHQQYN